MKDLMTARRERDAAMAQVETNTSPSWSQAAWSVLLDFGRYRFTFISDDVWEELEVLGVPEPHNKRALGPLMLRAAREGVIRKTGDYRPSPRRHMTPQVVWIGAR